MSRNNIQKLQAVQNFARRITSGTRKNDHITPSLKELRWLTVASELFYRSAITAFKCMSGCAPEYLSTQFIKRTEVSNRRTRNSQKLTYLFLKLQVDNELIITELQVYGIPLTRLLTFVGMQNFLNSQLDLSYCGNYMRPIFLGFEHLNKL